MCSPTYESAGIVAPILLLMLRILQGISAGGEWGGAVLMAVEHAPQTKRGLFGSFPQLRVPLGMLLASGVLALMSGVISPGQAFVERGWRVPFLLSFVLIVVGYIVRRSVDESPVFEEIARKKKQTRSIVVINALKVPVEAGSELEARFAARKHSVDGSPGFEGFQLLRPVTGEDRYFVYTQWATREDFENWRSNRAPHDSSAQAPVASGIDLLEFDVVDLA